ncbi:putative addiction module antidote protein [Rhizobium sp. SIMBA_035]|jgi:probable addiction module antidote protein
MPLETTRFDIQDHLKTPEEQIVYLEAAFEDGDPALIAHALGDVARAVGMTSVAKEAGVTREALYKSLSETGDPRLSTFFGVIKALGLKISISPGKDAA